MKFTVSEGILNRYGEFLVIFRGGGNQLHQVEKGKINLRPFFRHTFSPCFLININDNMRPRDKY